MPQKDSSVGKVACHTGQVNSGSQKAHGKWWAPRPVPRAGGVQQGGPDDWRHGSRAPCGASHLLLSRKKRTEVRLPLRKVIWHHLLKAQVPSNLTILLLSG